MEMNPCPMDRLDADGLAKYLEGCGLAPETVRVFKKEHISGQVFMRHLDEETMVKLNLPLGEKKHISHLITKERISERRSLPSLDDINSGSVKFVKAFQAIGIEEKTIRTLENENFADNLLFLERSDIESCPKADWKMLHHLNTELMSTNLLVHNFIKCTPVKVREWNPKEVERFLKTIFGRSWQVPTVFQNMTGEELVNLDKDSYKSQLRYDEFMTMSMALYYLHESIKESVRKPIDLHSKAYDWEHPENYQNTTKKTIESPTSDDAEIQKFADQEGSTFYNSQSGFETSQPETSQLSNPVVESNIIPNEIKTSGDFGQCSTETNLQAPHEFDKPLAKNFKYTKGRQLDRYESNRGSLLHRIHEFKLFAVDRNWERPLTDREFCENMLYEELPFASACLNSRQNGTIYFGIVDELKDNANSVGYMPREVVGVKSSHDTFQQELLSYSIKCFDRFMFRHREAAQQCIRGPRIIPVFDEDGTSTERHVIEYDINPHHLYTRGKIFKVEPPNNTSDKKRQWTKREAFYRDYDKGNPATKRIPDLLKYYEETGCALDEHRRFLELNNGSGKPDEKYTLISSFLAASDGNEPTPGYTHNNEVRVTQTASAVHEAVSDEAVNTITNIDQASRCTSAVPEWIKQGANNTRPQPDPFSDDEGAQITPSILDKTTRNVADHSPATGQTGDEFKTSQTEFDVVGDDIKLTSALQPDSRDFRSTVELNTAWNGAEWNLATGSSNADTLGADNRTCDDTEYTLIENNTSPTPQLKTDIREDRATQPTVNITAKEGMDRNPSTEPAKIDVKVQTDHTQPIFEVMDRD